MFSQPVRLADWIPPAGAGLVAVLAHDPNWSPKPFQPLYIGEFGHDARRSLESHGLPPAVLQGDVWVAVLPLPYTTSTQRRALRDELIEAYNPSKQFDPQAPVRRPIGFVTA